LVIKVSAGIGAGLVLDGKVHYGHLSTTGEIGHDQIHPAITAHLNAEAESICPDLEPLSPNSEFLRCSCVTGEHEVPAHLEAYASATAVTCRVLATRPHEIEPAQWRGHMQRIAEWAMSHESDAADAEERAAILRAQRAVEEAGILLGQQINTLATALGVEKVLIVGALAEVESLLTHIQDAIVLVRADGRSPSLTHAPKDVQFGSRGESGELMGVYGACRLALEQGVWGPPLERTDYWPGLEAAEAELRA
jgi:predicted NBD/HSP70 family sugar kinase